MGGFWFGTDWLASMVLFNDLIANIPELIVHGFLGIIVNLLFFFHRSDSTLKLSKFIVERRSICLVQLKPYNKLLPESLVFLLEFRKLWVVLESVFLTVGKMYRMSRL